MNAQNIEPMAKKHNCEHQEECLKMVQKIVDGQASDQEISDFKVKMDSCLPCEKNLALEKCIKETIQLRLEKKCVPASILDCIKLSLSKA